MNKPNKRSNNNKRNNGKRVLNERDNNNKNKKKNFWKKHHKLAVFLKALIAIMLLLFIIGAGVVIAIFNSDKWSMTNKDLTFKSINTVLCDKDGNEIADVSGLEKRKVIPLSEIPKNLKDAYISIEDERFYSHKGVDIKRTTAATVKYILNGGKSSYGGGSTITQQLIKNLKQEKDNSGLKGVQRKIRQSAVFYTKLLKFRKNR